MSVSKVWACVGVVFVEFTGLPLIGELMVLCCASSLCQEMNVAE